jgi:hypothetical protein
MQDRDWRGRVDRALHQRIYMLPGMKCSPSGVECHMVGTTNTYKLNLQRDGLMTCTCPDYTRRRAFCKHLLNLLLKVLHVAQEKVFQNNLRCDSSYFELCEQFLAKQSLPPREVEPDDDCPVCLERLLVSGESLISCCTCRKSVHTDCYQKCVAFISKCVYCRSDWSLDAVRCVAY